MAGRARSRRFGIRARVVASFLVLLVTAEVVSIVVLHQVGTNEIDEQVTAHLTTVTDDLAVRLANEAALLGRDGGESLRAVFEQFLQARPARAGQAYLAIVDGRPFAASTGSPVALEAHPLVATWATTRATASGEVETAQGPMRWLAVPVLAGDELLGVFVATELVADQQQALRDTIALVATLTGLVLVAASLLAWSAAGRALRPLRRLARATRSVAGGDDLGARVRVDGHDEVADLGASVNGMLDRLQRSFETQQAFLDDAGHELRAPITVVRGHVELLDDDPEVRAEEAALILDELDRMERLVTDLRLLARSERPDFLDVDAVDVESFVGDVGRKARTIAPRDWAVDVRTGGTVRADRQRLTQAMLNLSENAARATADGDRIEIVADAVGGRLALSVRDTGAGIPAEDLPSLFDRAGRAVRRRVSGTGLGLPIVAAIATAHGGEATVASAVGEGTTVTLLIPGLRATPPGRGEAAPRRAHPPRVDHAEADDPTTDDRVTDESSTGEASTGEASTGGPRTEHRVGP